MSGAAGAAILLRMGTFDAALLEALLLIGVPAERARAVVDLFDRRIDERYSLHAQVLATKRDVAELHTRIAEVNASLSARITENVRRFRTGEPLVGLVDVDLGY